MGHLSREAGSPTPATLPAPNFPIHRHEQRVAECRVRSDDGNAARPLDPRRCKLAAMDGAVVRRRALFATTPPLWSRRFARPRQNAWDWFGCSARNNARLIREREAHFREIFLTSHSPLGHAGSGPCGSTIRRPRLVSDSRSLRRSQRGECEGAPCHAFFTARRSASRLPSYRSLESAKARCAGERLAFGVAFLF